MTLGTTRGRAAVGVLAAGVLLTGTVAAVGMDQGRTPPVAAPAPSPSAPPVRADLLPAASVDAPVPTLAGLQPAVAAARAGPGFAGALAVSVVDPVTGEVVYERGATLPLLPASTAKIATAVAALTALDPQARLTTRVVAGSAPGEVVLVGGGDPTLASAAAPRGYPVRAKGRPSILSAIRAAIDMMVSAGFALPCVGSALPPPIHRLGTAKVRPISSTTPSAADAAIRAPPTRWA